MPWIKVVDEKESEGELKGVYDLIKLKRGKIGNILKIQSLNPKAMESHLSFYIDIMFGKSSSKLIKRELRELIATTISITNKCEYCIIHHSEALLHYWKDKDKLKRYINDFNSIKFPDRIQIILDYCIKLTKNPDQMTENDVQTLRDQNIEDEEILNINLITSYFNFVNRVASGLGVEFTEEEVKGYKY